MDEAFAGDRYGRPIVGSTVAVVYAPCGHLDVPLVGQILSNMSYYAQPKKRWVTFLEVKFDTVSAYDASQILGLGYTKDDAFLCTQVMVVSIDPSDVTKDVADTLAKYELLFGGC